MKRNKKNNKWVYILLATMSFLFALLLIKPVRDLFAKVTGINSDELEAWAVSGLSIVIGITLCIVAISFAAIPVIGISIAVIGALSLIYSGVLLYQRLNNENPIEIPKPRIK